MIINNAFLAGEDSIESFEGTGEDSSISKRLFSEKTDK